MFWRTTRTLEREPFKGAICVTSSTEVGSLVLCGTRAHILSWLCLHHHHHQGGKIPSSHHHWAGDKSTLYSVLTAAVDAAQHSTIRES